MRGRLLATIAAVLATLVPAVATSAPAFAAPPLAAPVAAAGAPGALPAGNQGLRVSGSALVFGPGAGTTVQIRGVSRSGLEYQCIQNNGFFEGPTPDQIDSPAMVSAMLSWEINAVRVPLNEDCWLGINAPARYSGAAYRRIVERYVAELNAAGLFVILDLHWVAPGTTKATQQLQMADADHTPAFWRSVATAFAGNGEVIFDLFNEPYGIGWSCWLNGCEIPAQHGVPAYRAAGMQQLVDAVRSTGARQPLLIGGTQWAWSLSQWLVHEPRDPLHDLIASEHNYGGLSPCPARCQGWILSTSRRVPVIMGELGETDCGQGYIDPMLRFADAHGIGYSAWAWDTGKYWTCRNGPSLITSYAGTPTAYGAGYRAHLLALGAPVRP